MDNWFREPISKQPIFIDPSYEIDWRGTIGVGDSLYGLNAAYALAHMYDHPVHMRMVWPHEREFNYHFEDPETIIERTDYFHNFYHNKDLVTIEHVFDPDDPMFKTKGKLSTRWRGFGHTRDPNRVIQFTHWAFRKDLWDCSIPKKVVFWRPTFNREIPSGTKKWKMTFSVKEWERIIHFLELKGYDLVELTYRTPASEALYHIKTAQFCVYYDGMWQYIARNLCKPSITLGGNAIARIHSPHAVWFRRPTEVSNEFTVPTDFWDYLYNLPENEKHLSDFANIYKTKLMDKIDDFYD